MSNCVYLDQSPSLHSYSLITQPPTATVALARAVCFIVFGATIHKQQEI